MEHSQNGHAPSEPGVITTSTGTETTYYGQPVIRAPNWHWLVVHYLYLGGVAGASAVIAVLSDFFGGDRSVGRAARYMAAAAIIPCPAFLALDLGRPDRALHMLRIIKLRSPLSVGSWALTFASVFTLGAATIQAVEDLLVPSFLSRVKRGLSIAGLPFSYYLSGYTGILLSVTNVPLWARMSPLLSASFVSSAFSNAFAAISLILHLQGGENETSARKLARAETACLAAEFTLLAASVTKAGKLGRPLTRGRWGAFFWPVTMLGGIAVPLALQLAGPARGKAASSNRRILTSVLVLVGGYVLRMCMVFAGHVSASRPEDYFELTKQGNR